MSVSVGPDQKYLWKSASLGKSMIYVQEETKHIIITVTTANELPAMTGQLHYFPPIRVSSDTLKQIQLKFNSAFIYIYIYIMPQQN